MDAVTYPQEEIEKEVTAQFIPARLISAENREISKQFDVRWLPATVVTDASLLPHSKSIGFLPPEDLLCEMTFGRGMAAMTAKNYDEAKGLLVEVADRWPTLERAPEALYWASVIEIRQSKSFETCQPHFQRILDQYPESQWTRKVDFILEAVQKGHTN